MKKTARIIMTVSLTVVGLTTIGVSAYYLIEYFKPSEVSTGVFNDVATNLELSEDSFDVATINMYKQNTASVLVKKSSTEGSMGTIWNYGYKESVIGGARHYFATNIHVISSVIKTSSDEVGFWVPPNNFAYKALNDTREKWMREVKIEKINAYEKFGVGNAPKAGIEGNDVGLSYIQDNWYSDFVILSTTTPIFTSANPPFNFLDDSEEFDWLEYKMNAELGDLSFYICGFPAAANEQTTWPESATWTAVKYAWGNAPKYAGKFPAMSSSSQIFTIEYLKDTDPNSGETIGGELYKNYAHQLILPKLNMRGGSSGSLVTAKYKDPITAENTWLAVGIYWGGYSSNTNDSLFLGAIDLFYTPKFDYINISDSEKTLRIQLEYNNLYTIN